MTSCRPPEEARSFAGIQSSRCRFSTDVRDSWPQLLYQLALAALPGNLTPGPALSLCHVSGFAGQTRSLWVFLLWVKVFSQTLNRVCFLVCQSLFPAVLKRIKLTMEPGHFWGSKPQRKVNAGTFCFHPSEENKSRACFTLTTLLEILCFRCTAF